mmetsp:Transcript_5577/g.11541  ORF Transcript_5577/g.11541 Transcript_5577/m.11541 type:complete len:650 (-) Transcript_5577:127-2076(-)
MISLMISLALALLAVTGMISSTLSPAEAFCASTILSRTVEFSTRSTTTVSVSQSNEGNEKETKREGGEESEEEFQRRMAVVRSLQMSFYGEDALKEETSSNGKSEDEGSSSTSSSPYGLPELDVQTGRIKNLSLFRAAWYELPGRSNVLIIRDPVYTNMFERMFYTVNNDDNDSENIEPTSNNKMTPWVFGHVYTPRVKKDKKSKKTLPKKTNASRQFLAWNETNRNVDTTASALSSPAVLGTLMYVRDYRRLKDGRILALVQAAEKFVVDEIRQSLPYAIADVKILPDVEELGLEETSGVDASKAETIGENSDEDSSSTLPSSVYSCDENDEDERFLVNCLRADEGTSVGPARARATFESIHSYHHYECDPQQRLDGIPQKSDLGIIDITHDAISKALPYCRFSNTTEPLTRLKELTWEEKAKPMKESTTPSPSLEFQLLRRGITKIPPSDRRFSYNTEPTYEGNEAIELSSRPWTTDELEYELWLVLDYFSAATKKPISPILLALLPSEDQMPKAWPSNFRLKDMLEEHRRKNPQTMSRSSSDTMYPNQRRQRRFSFSAAHLLESVLPISEGSSSSNHAEGIYSDNFRNGGRRCAPQSSDKTGTFGVDEIQELRSLLLSIPSTRQRLRVVLETFHRWRLYQESDEFA